VLAECGDRTYEAPFRGYLGTLRLEQGRPDDAVGTIDDALRSMRETGNVRYEALFEGYACAALALVGKTADAHAALGRANAKVAAMGDPRHKECIDLLGAALVLDEVRVKKASDPRVDVRALFSTVRRAIEAARKRGPPTEESRDGTPSAAERSDDVRRAIRILERALVSAEIEEDEVTAKR